MTDNQRADPILVRRERWRRLGASAQRVGYTCFLVATVLFFAGLLTSFRGLLVTGIVVLLIGGSIVLAVGIQVQYAIRGAQRHEEESQAQRRRY